MHKMQRPRVRQGLLSSVHELLGRGRVNSFKTKGAGGAERNICIMLCDLPDRRKTYHRQLSSIAEVYADVPTIVLEFLQVGRP